MKKRTVSVEIDEGVYELVKEWCEWAGDDTDRFIEWSILQGVYGFLDQIRGKIPRADVFFAKLDKLTEEGRG
jgi:hypothetical protein